MAFQRRQCTHAQPITCSFPIIIAPPLIDTPLLHACCIAVQAVVSVALRFSPMMTMMMTTMVLAMTAAAARLLAVVAVAAVTPATVVIAAGMKAAGMMAAGMMAARMMAARMMSARMMAARTAGPPLPPDLQMRGTVLVTVKLFTQIVNQATK